MHLYISHHIEIKFTAFPEAEQFCHLCVWHHFVEHEVCHIVKNCVLEVLACFHDVAKHFLVPFLRCLSTYMCCHQAARCASFLCCSSASISLLFGSYIAVLSAGLCLGPTTNAPTFIIFSVTDFVSCSTCILSLFFCIPFFYEV